jgi:glycosyltransferase involved in cell wall biosynthesis
MRHVASLGGSSGVRQQVVLSIYDSVDNPHYGGGGATVVREVAEKLATRYRVTVLAAAFPGSVPRVVDGVRYRFVPIGWAGPRAGQLLFHAALPVAARTVPHDLWIESFTPPFSTSFLPMFTRRPVIGLIQFLSGGPMSRRYHLPFDRIERRGLRHYRNLVTLNAADAAVVRRHAPQADVTVIGNGTRLPAPETIRAGEGDFILYLGRLDVAGKGLDLLLSAHARMAHPLPLLVAGTGSRTERERLAQLAAGHPAPVELLGAVGGQRKEDLLRACAYLVMPSRFETFGLAALEAMAYGHPVIHFDLPQLAWIGNGGVAVAPFDEAALAREMDRLAVDEQVRAARGRSARSIAEEQAWERVTDRYVELVDRILARSAAERAASGARTRA